ncbi:hypothetical protein ACWCL1_08080 [Ligilactobacillus sp. LYQ135]
MKKILIGGLLILNLLVGFQVFKELKKLPDTTQIRTEYQTTAKQVSNLKSNKKKINTQTVEKKIADQNINLNNIENQTKQNISDALDKAYNQTHNKQDFTDLKNKLPKLVGQSLADNIIAQSTPTVTSKGEQYPNSKMNSYTINFGKYDLLSQTIPVEINVEFTTFDNKSAYGFYTAVLNAKTGKITNANYIAMTSVEDLNKGALDNG